MIRVASSRVLVEEALQHVDHELHGRVVVVEQQHAVQVRTLGPRLGLRDDRGPESSLSPPPGE